MVSLLGIVIVVWSTCFIFGTRDILGYHICIYPYSSKDRGKQGRSYEPRAFQGGSTYLKVQGTCFCLILPDSGLDLWIQELLDHFFASCHCLRSAAESFNCSLQGNS